MAVATDVLQTRLDLIGLSAYTSGINQIIDGIGAFGGKLDDAKRKQLSLTIAAGTGAAAIVHFLGKSAVAAGEEAAAFQRAAITFQSYGNSFPTGELKSFSSELQGLTGVADDQIGSFIGLLGSFNMTKKQAKEFAVPILDAAEALKAQGVTTESLAVSIGKALQTGNVGALRRSGIVVDQVRAKTDLYGAVLDAVTKQGQGAAVAFRHTLPGAMQAASNSFADLQEAIGEPLIGPLTAVTNVAGKFADVLAQSKPLAVAVTTALVAGAGAMAFYAIQTGIALRNTLRLAEARLKDAGAAGVQATANTVAGTTAAASSGAAVVGGAAGKGGMRGIVGKIGKGGGPLGLLAGLGLGIAADAAGRDTNLGKGLGIGEGAAAGAGTGAFIGSFVPGIGTAAGAIAGGLIGGGTAAYGAFSGGPTAAKPATPAGDPHLEELKKISRNTEQMKQAVGSQEIYDALGGARVAREFGRGI